MNQTIETILNRRSVRVYSEEQIKKEDLDLILQAGCYAQAVVICNPGTLLLCKTKIS